MNIPWAPIIPEREEEEDDPPRCREEGKEENEENEDPRNDGTEKPPGDEDNEEPNRPPWTKGGPEVLDRTPRGTGATPTYPLLDSGTPRKYAQKKEPRSRQGTKMTESQNTPHLW